MCEKNSLKIQKTIYFKQFVQIIHNLGTYFLQTYLILFISVMEFLEKLQEQ